jgi:AraC-like DNA-binding protein
LTRAAPPNVNRIAPLDTFPTWLSAELRRYTGVHAAHTHDHAQVLLGLGGVLELEIEGRGLRVDASCGLVIPAGERHCFEAIGKGGAQAWVIDAPAGAALARTRSFALQGGWQQPADSAALQRLLGAAARALPRRRLEVARLAAAVDVALHEPWPTQRMAALFHLSVPRFHARWRALTGCTPQDWLRARRLDAAEALLRRGVNLEAAALQVGYRSASALWHALRRERGQGARALRGG